MTHRHSAALVAFALALAALSWTLRPAEAQEGGYRGAKWEYRVFRMDPADYSDKSDYRHVLAREGARKVDSAFQEYVLNHLGDDGWELVTVEQRAKNLVYFYVKRPKT